MSLVIERNYTEVISDGTPAGPLLKMTQPVFVCQATDGALPIFHSSTWKKRQDSALRNVLLVGGCGYIGSYLFERLIANGFTVSVCDKLSRGNPLNLPITSLDYNDLTPEELARFETILWFAGHSSVGQSITDPQGAIANNCLNLFSFAKKLPATTKLIYASTASLYPLNDTLAPLTEDSLIRIPAQHAYDI